MGNKTRKSIQAFWKGGFTETEAKNLLDNLEKQQPDLQEELKTEFVEERGRQKLLSPERSDELLQAIRSRAGMQTPVRKLSSYRWIGVAAVFLVFFMFGFYYMLDHSKKALPQMQYTADAPYRTYAVASQNDSLRHVLDDGSVVVLSPHSVVLYDKGYGIHNRSLQLIGEGKFAVKRDTTLPFVVTTNGFTTTALGTEFIVDGRNVGKTTVQLLSGKVVIRSTKTAGMVIQDTYLAAGEMLYIDQEQQTALKNPAVTTKPARNANALDQRTAKADTHLRKNLRFERNDLVDVIRQVAIKFDTVIVIGPEVPRNLTFTGEFSADDDLQTILQTICLVNDLQHDSGDANEVVIRLKQIVPHQEVDINEIK